MDDEQAIKLEMRLWALEVLVCNILAVIASSDSDPNELMKKTREQMISGAQQHTFPEVDPAMSDLLSAELEAAITRLMDMANSQIGMLQGRRATR
jgi:hypothetical protein